MTLKKYFFILILFFAISTAILAIFQDVFRIHIENFYIVILGIVFSGIGFPLFVWTKQIYDAFWKAKKSGSLPYFLGSYDFYFYNLKYTRLFGFAMIIAGIILILGGIFNPTL